MFSLQTVNKVEGKKKQLSMKRKKNKISSTHSGVATKGPELETDADRPMDFFSVRNVPGVLGGVTSPVERASTSLDSESLPGLRISFTDTTQENKSGQTATQLLFVNLPIACESTPSLLDQGYGEIIRHHYDFVTCRRYPVMLPFK